MKYTAAYLRIDTIEQGIRDLCSADIEYEGYQLTHRIVADNLKLGINVVADSCNPFELTRNDWENVALENDARFINVEVICSDKNEHKKRVETRASEIKGLQLPTWDDIQKREYHAWKKERIVIDTANKGVQECVAELFKKMDEI